jgi:hypothetical protein
MPAQPSHLDTSHPVPLRNSAVLSLATRHWKVLFLIAGIGALGGLVASFIITPKYRAEAVLFPAVTSSVSKALLADTRTTGDDLLALGEEKDLEHLMQLLRSATVRDRAAERFNLYEAYGITSEMRYPRSEFIGIYEDVVTFRKTRFNSIKVEALDADPERAVQLVNFICDQVDTVWREMIATRLRPSLELLDQHVRTAENDMRLLTDSLTRLQAAGANDFETQAERYHEYIGAAIVKNDRRALEALEERMTELRGLGGPYIAMSEQIMKWSWRINELRAKRDLIRSELVSEIPFKFVVDKAVVHDKPAYPQRWLLVLVGAISGLLFALLVIALRTDPSHIQTPHVE